jgi:NAD(P)-binding Rossmann-like domain
MGMDTDYLVVGAGASGLAFADTLLAEAPNVAVTLVDRRDAPGGHWQQVYPFVRLHTPSAFYGVNSTALGDDRIDQTGENAGFYERATGADVREYFAAVAERLTRTGRVHILVRHEHLGAGAEGEQVRDLATGEVQDIRVRRKVVDARYLEASIPATHVPPFEVAPSARLVPVNDLPEMLRPRALYSVIGSGKTAVDACVWLLDNGVEPDRIRWIRPRDAWFHDRRHFQPLAQVAGIMEGLALDAEAGAQASSIDDLVERLESTGRLVRVDPSRPTTMYRGTMLSSGELDAVRQIKDVLRLGHVRRIEVDRVLLDRGEAAPRPEAVHIDCAALGLNNAPGTPVFHGDRIVLQQVRHLSPCFNAALIAFVEAHRDEDADKNRLCPPNPYPSSIEDWPAMMTRTWRAESRWLREPDLASWVAASRLNLLRDFPEHAAEPAASAAVERFLTHVPAAIERLGRLSAPSPSLPTREGQ